MLLRHAHHVYISIALIFGVSLAGAWQLADAGAAYLKAALPRVCASQPAGWHLPGVILSGPRLHGLAVDDRTGHAFVLSSGSYDLSGRYVCATGVLTLNAWNGRLLQTTPISLGEGPSSYASLALHGRAHRLLAVDSGDILPQHPQRNGSLSFLDTRSGRLLKSISVGLHPGPIAIDEATYRAFVLVNTNPARAAGGDIAAIAVTRGIVVRAVSVSQQVRDIAVDQRAGRVFLLGSSVVTTLDGAGGQILNTVALPGGFHVYNGYGLDERTGRLFVAEVGLAPPHSSQPNPPNTLSVIDSHTGAILRTITEGSGILAGKVLVDQPARIVLSWGTNTDATTATVLDARDGLVREQIKLGLPPAGFNGPTMVDPRTGDIFGFTGRGIRVVHPGAWSQSRTVSPGSILGLNLALSPSTHRGFALQLETAQNDTVRAFCTNASCH